MAPIWISARLKVTDGVPEVDVDLSVSGLWKLEDSVPFWGHTVGEPIAKSGCFLNGITFGETGTV
tara:strand:+ start:384 stop:578 length:195 start_codon:yes stop_codon:yes gene_type:complete